MLCRQVALLVTFMLKFTSNATHDFQIRGETGRVWHRGQFDPPT